VPDIPSGIRMMADFLIIMAQNPNSKPQTLDAVWEEEDGDLNPTPIVPSRKRRIEGCLRVLSRFRAFLAAIVWSSGVVLVISREKTVAAGTRIRVRMELSCVVVGSEIFVIMIFVNFLSSFFLLFLLLPLLGSDEE